jgi:hypothetical protein
MSRKLLSPVVSQEEFQGSESYLASEERIRLRELCILICASQFFEMESDRAPKEGRSGSADK